MARLRLTLYTSLDRGDRGVEVFLDYLRHCGTDWSPHPSRDEVMLEYDRIWEWVGNRRIQDLVDLPLMSDPDVIGEKLMTICMGCSWTARMTGDRGIFLRMQPEVDAIVGSLVRREVGRTIETI